MNKTCFLLKQYGVKHCAMKCKYLIEFSSNMEYRMVKISAKPFLIFTVCVFIELTPHMHRQTTQLLKNILLA